jgi:hypothetical protein
MKQDKTMKKKYQRPEIFIHELDTESVMGTTLSIPKDNSGSTNEQLSKKFVNDDGSEGDGDAWN